MTVTHESLIHAQLFAENYVKGARTKKELQSAGPYRRLRGHHYYIHDKRFFNISKFGTEGYQILQEIYKKQTGRTSVSTNLFNRMLNFDL